MSSMSVILFPNSLSMYFSILRLLTSLKGHGDRVLSIGLSPNDKFLASSSQDRSLILWPSKHFVSNDHRSTRGNVAYDVRFFT